MWYNVTTRGHNWAPHTHIHDNQSSTICLHILSSPQHWSFTEQAAAGQWADGCLVGELSLQPFLSFFYYNLENLFFQQAVLCFLHQARPICCYFFKYWRRVRICFSGSREEEKQTQLVNRKQEDVCDVTSQCRWQTYIYIYIYIYFLLYIFYYGEKWHRVMMVLYWI